MNNVNREILRLSIPAIISNITIPLLGLCDTSIAGHLGDNIFLAAIAAATMSINTIYWPFGFLRMGTTGLTAQAFGEKSKRKSEIIFSKALLIALLAGVILICLQVPLEDTVVRFIAGKTGIASIAGEYFRICIYGAPAMLATMAISGWFLGMQSSLYPMIIAIASNVGNIIMSCILVFGCSMGFTGIAVGTLCSAWLGFALALILVWHFNKKKLPVCKFRDLVDSNGLSNFFKVNTDIFFRSLCIIAVSMSVTAIGARIGAVTLASNAVMMQFFVLFSYFMDGFAFAAEALTGKCIGARDRSNLKLVVKNILLWGASMALIFTIIYLFGNTLISRLITNDHEVLRQIENYRIYILSIPVITVCAFIFDGIYIGLTATRNMLFATLISAIIFFAINLFPAFQGNINGTHAFDNHILWTAFLSYLLGRGTILAVLYPSAVRKAFLNT